MNSDTLTSRARRRRAVAAGERETAVERQGSRRESSDRPASSRVRQRQAAAEVAGETGVDTAGVGTVERIGGMDVFLRGPGPEQFGEQVADEFASSADFVETADVAPNVNAADISAAPVVAEGRRDDVAARAREQAASGAEFIRGDDLDAEVGALGVTGLGIAEDRRDDVAARARAGFAADDPFAEPGDFGVDVTASGIESAGFTDAGARRRAGRQFESETPLDTVDPATDLTATGAGGFTLGESAEQRAAARSFEARASWTPATYARPATGSGSVAIPPARSPPTGSTNRRPAST